MDLIAPRRPAGTRCSYWVKDLRNVIMEPKQWAMEPKQWALNKANPAIGMAKSFATGDDWRSEPFAVALNGEPTKADWVAKALGLIGDAFVPIPAEGDKNPRSNIGWVETVAGIRPAGQQYTTAEAVASGARLASALGKHDRGSTRSTTAGRSKLRSSVTQKRPRRLAGGLLTPPTIDLPVLAPRARGRIPFLRC